MKIVATIPARFGSKRIKQKNLRPLDGKPLICYAIDAAKNARRLNEIYVNTESDIIGKIALDRDVRYYKRDDSLAQDTVSSDEFNYDFMKNVEADVVVMVNPVAPLVTGEDIDNMVDYYLEHDLDTLIAVRDERLHAFYENSPVNFNPGGAVKTLCEPKAVNFDPTGPLPMTQNIAPIRICAWTICIWRTATFIREFESKGYAVFSGKVDFYPMKQHKAVKISTEDDFILAEVLLKNEYRWRIREVPYDSNDAKPDYPAMWLSEIAFIEKLLLEQARDGKALNILEWGSGRSTVYFSNTLKKNNIKFQWHAIENFIPWHKEVVSMIEKNGLSDTTTCHLKSATCEERKEVQEKMDMNEFLGFPASLDTKFDLIFIDARKRRECLERASKLLAKDGAAILHDAERKEHQQAFNLYSESSFVCENKSPVPGGVQKLWVGRHPR